MEGESYDESRRPPSSMMPCCGRFTLFSLGAGAVTMSAFSLFSCEFFSYRALDGQPWEGLTPPFENLASATVGLLRYSKSTTTSSHADMFGGQCKVYEDWNDVGSQRYFVVAQWCSLVAPALAILALLQIVCEWCCCRLRGSYIYMQISFFAAGVFQFCSFFVFMEDQFCLDPASQNECSLEKGAVYSLVAGGVYMIVAVCFTLMKPYKDAAACGLGGCCIITHNIGYIEDISEDGNKKPEKLEGDTSDDDEFPVEDDEKSPDQDIESSFDDFDDDDYHQLPIINYERHQALLVAPGDPTSPTAGTEDKYARDGGGNNGGGDLELATDSDLVSNNSKDADDGPAWDNANDGTNANQEEKATNGMPATTTTRDGEPSTGNAAGKDDGNVDSGATVHSGSPDFLDTMCCGDPLELEKYMSGKICVSKNGSSNKNKKTKKDGRKQDAYTKRSEPLRASLRKIALVTEASNREKRTIYVGNPPPGGKL